MSLTPGTRLGVYEILSALGAGGRSIMTTHMADVWIRKLDSFDDAQRADREFWRSVPPDARVAAVEDLRRQWARLQGADDEGLRRTVRVLAAPER